MGKLTGFFLRGHKQKSETEKVGDIGLYKSKAGISTVFITVFCVNPDFLEEIILTTTRRLSSKSKKLIYLTDNPDFTTFRRHGVMFEYMPALTEQRRHAADMPWQAYLRERWRLLLAKWRPRQVLAYGTNIDDFLAAAPITCVDETPDLST